MKTTTTERSGLNCDCNEIHNQSLKQKHLKLNLQCAMHGWLNDFMTDVLLYID